MGLGNSPMPQGAWGAARQKHSNRLSGRCWLFWLLLLPFDWSSTGFKSFKPQLWSENEVRCLRNSCWKQLGSLWSLWLASKQLPEGRGASELSWACMCCGKTKRLSLNKAWLASLCWRIQAFPHLSVCFQQGTYSAFSLLLSSKNQRGPVLSVLIGGR